MKACDRTDQRACKVDIVTNWQDLDSLGAEWDSLASECVYASIYLSYLFCKTEWEVFFEKTSTLFCLVIRNQASDELLSVVPFRIGKEYVRNFPILTLYPLATQEADKPYPLVRHGYEDVVWKTCADTLRSCSSRWSLLIWPEFRDSQIGQAAFVEGLSGDGFAVETQEDVSGPMIDLQQDWMTFSGRHRKFRKAHSRMNRKLEGGVSLHVASDVSEVQKSLEIYRGIERTSWKKDRVGISKNCENWTFYQTLIERLAIAGLVRIGIMYHGKVPISGEIAYVYGDTVFFSHGTFNPEYAEFSPGKISTGLFIKGFLDCGYKRGDFLGGFADYLSPWSDWTVRSNELTVYNLTPCIYAIWKWRILRGRFRRLISFTADAASI